MTSASPRAEVNTGIVDPATRAEFLVVAMTEL
jgi:hypothetical protein